MKLHFLIVVCSLLVIGAPVLAQDDVESCLSCHEDDELTGENLEGEEISVFISLEHYTSSVHGELECVDCHEDLAGFDDYPHEDQLQPVDCGSCHDDVTEALNQSIHTGETAACSDCHGKHRIVSPGDSEVGDHGVNCGPCHSNIAQEYAGSLHGQEVQKNAELAPRCWDCHGAHDIVDAQSPYARTAKFNIPFMCGRCHKEGSPVDRAYDIPQDSILSHYSLSIHGEGLFKQGLTVTAVCSDCHTAHNVRDHSDPKSSIHRDNVAATCQQCHGRISQVHREVIEGRLWESEPDKVPVCVDCHEPHEIRRVYYGEVSDQECLTCHSNPDLKMNRNGTETSLYVDTTDVHGSIHRTTACAQCHTGARPDHDRPCATVTPKVDCSICHSEQVIDFNASTHGKLTDRGDPDAPECIDCHGKHDVLGRRDRNSPTFPTNVPGLCGECHNSAGVVGQRRAAKGKPCVSDQYAMSIHGKGLLESGLVVTAMCTDCHSTHRALPHDDPTSSISPDSISQTCAKCHDGIYEKFSKSIHSSEVSESTLLLPNCADCHESHGIARTDTEQFRELTLAQCGQCHAEVTESYFETFHGKVSKLGYEAAARCHDCHGSHDILPPDDPHSHLSRQNIVATCGSCHPGSHRQFAGYLTHATHHDKVKYPILYYTFWFMTVLLVGTLVVAGTHTLLWLPRSFQAMREHKILRKSALGKLEYRRFKPLHSRLHVMVVISFLGLALTGMTLKFSYLGWAQWLSEFMGGFDSAAFIHRVCAIITFLYFMIHIWDIVRQKRRERKSWKAILFHSNSMLPNRNDISEAVATLKWFVGMGPRPEYGRWTYWEKFDYFAVFWGVAIIGTTGLMLWFPEFFTLFLPGWIINVASIIHSDEALLATAFIFTVHFFNTHFRPDKFPMDTVIFTGRVPLEELKQDRPREYQELMKSGNIKRHLVEPLHPSLVRGIRIFATIALLIGLSIILLILYAEIFGYR